MEKSKEELKGKYLVAWKEWDVALAVFQEAKERLVESTHFGYPRVRRKEAALLVAVTRRAAERALTVARQEYARSSA